jgi:hypothetical protein
MSPAPSNCNAATEVPRSLLRDCLANEGAPLGPWLRSDLETRFGCGLGDVRIHTGRPATALCEAMKSRALTLGRDVFFGDREYAPATPYGRRLLAHELVHVLQQRAARPRSPSQRVILGDELDPVEIEADRLADEVMGAGLRSAITPDISGIMRPTIRLSNATARMEPIHAGARPGITFVDRGGRYGKMALLHLTRNHRELITAPSPEAAHVIRGSAMQISATVMVTNDNLRDNVRKSWDFHLLTLYKAVKDVALYAGKEPPDGSMSLNFAGRTHYTGHGKFLLDSIPDIAPYYNLHPFTITAASASGGVYLATVVSYDHPHAQVPLSWPNDSTGKDNYLYKAEREFELITAFVAIDLDTGKRHILSHLKWGANLDADIDWALAGTEAKGRVTGRFHADLTATLGPPTDRALETMILTAGSGDPMYNSEAKVAQAKVLRATKSDSDVNILKTRLPSVPPNHFKK